MKGDAGRLAKRVAPARQSHLGCLVLCVPARSQLLWRRSVASRDARSSAGLKSVVSLARSVWGGFGYVFSVGTEISDTVWHSVPEPSAREKRHFLSEEGEHPPAGRYASTWMLWLAARFTLALAEPGAGQPGTAAGGALWQDPPAGMF